MKISIANPLRENGHDAAEALCGPSAPSLLLGPGLEAFANGLRSAFGAELSVRTVSLTSALAMAVQGEPTTLMAVVVNLASGAKESTATLNGIRAGLAARGQTPPPQVVGLAIDAESAGLLRAEHADLLGRVMVMPKGWEPIYSVLVTRLGNVDDALWEDLNPVQRGLLKLTKKAMARLEGQVGRGEALDTEALDEMSSSIIEAGGSGDLLESLEILRSHHSNTFGHSLKVASYMTAFGMTLGFSKSDLKIVAQAGLCHDLGKSLVPAEILDAPRKLTEAEFAVMKTHPEAAVPSLEKTVSLHPKIKNVAVSHHEKLNGTGYPLGLKGAEIDDLALICAISDVYAALTEKRAYKPKMSAEETFRIMDGMADGGHFEPAFYRSFKAMILSNE